MLNRLSVLNYAIVQQLEIDFKPGMSVITGETGAGKSIILGALRLTLGDRSDKGLVRSGASKTDISAQFDTANNEQAQQWLRENDLNSEQEPDTCLLRRMVSDDGRSKAWINGHPATLQSIKTIGEMLIDIHSQHEHQSLLARSTHQRLLDEFSGQQKLAASVKQLFTQWKKNRQTLEQLSSLSDELSAQFQLVSYQLEELDQINLGVGELQALEEEHSKLSNADTTVTTVQQVLNICNEDEGQSLLRGLNHALGLLDELKYKDRSLITTIELLGTATIQIDEVVSELSKTLDQFEINPQRLEEINTRMADIHQIARKHKVKPTQLLELVAELQQQLEGYQNSDERVEQLKEQDQHLADEYRKQARQLSAHRRKAGKDLATRINAQLQHLGMVNASLEVQLTPNDGDSLSANGLESVEFLVSTNPGQQARPLIKIASGGELSRISLAIQVITAQTSNIPTLVFDEVDVGIGGGVARSVGELLRQIGDKGQVLCVTHQAQVASQGHHHLFVSKKSGSASTEVMIHELGKEETVREVARMLGGEEFSEQSLAHAQEMVVNQ